MAEWKQLDQAIYTTPQRALWAAWNWLVGTVGWREVVKVGTWTTPGDALVNNDGVDLKSPVGAPFEQQIALGYTTSGHTSLTVNHFPWSGVAGGWDGISSFVAPIQSGFHWLPYSSSFKMTAIANDATILLLAWWTPSTVSGVSMTFAASGKTITRATGSWLADGYTPGAAISVTGSASNNYSWLVTAVSATVLTVHSSPPSVVNETVSCTITPTETARLVYAGRIIPYESATDDVRPAVLNCTHWGMGGVDQQTTKESALVGYKRIHANVGSGYLNLAAGGLDYPTSYAGFVPLQKNPTFTGNRHSRSCELTFAETVSAVERIEQPGRLDGVYFTDTALSKQRISQTITLPNGTTRTTYLMARQGIAVIWPSGAEII